MKTLIILLLFCGISQAQDKATFTVTTPTITQEQVDWNDIYNLDADRIEAYKKAKTDIKYDKYKTEINNKQEILQIQRRRELSRIKNKTGHASYIDPCHKENEIEKIKADDIKVLDEGGFATPELLGLIALFTLCFMLLPYPWNVVSCVLLAFMVLWRVLVSKSKKKGLKRKDEANEL